MIDLTSLIFNLVILIADLAGMYSKDVTTWMGIAVLLVWLKLFYFGRIFYSTAAMIRMVIEIAYDMKYFLLILLLTVTGFGNAYFILASSNLTDGVYFTGDTFWRAFIYAYNQSLGSFDTSAYAGTDKHLLFTIWWLNTMIVLIIMLNLLIAIMGDTFDRVQETSENNMLKELASIMVENEMLINRHRMFGEAKYIIIIQEEKADESEVSWEGKLQYLKKYMDKTVIDQSKLLKSLEKEIVQIKEKVEKKGKEMESSANKYFNVIFEKTDYVQTLIDENIQKYKPSGE